MSLNLYIVIKKKELNLNPKELPQLQKIQVEKAQEHVQNLMMNSSL